MVKPQIGRIEQVNKELHRQAMSLFEARDVIAKGSGTDFDPRVVDAFMEAFRRGELEVTAVVV